MIGEDVKNKFVAYCFIWNLAELHEVKVTEEAKKAEAENVVKKLLVGGMSAVNILVRRTGDGFHPGLFILRILHIIMQGH